MQISKPLAFVITFFLISLNARTQSLWNLNKDSLLKILPNISDSSRINCMNKLGIFYLLNGNKDSALYYAGIAKTESLKLNYFRGTAEALTLMGACEVDYTNNYLAAQNFLTEALKWFGSTSNKGNIAFTYYKLGHTYHTIGQYKEANINYQRAVSSFRLNNDLTGIGRTLNFISNVYMENGEYDSAFQYLRDGIEFAKENNTDTIISFMFLGDFYRQVSDYQTSLEYYRELYRQLIKRNDTDYVHIFNQIGVVLGLNSQYDSALYYFDKALNINPSDRETEIGMGEIFLKQEKYDVALGSFEEPYFYYKKINDVNTIMRLQLDIGRALAGKGEYNKVDRLGHDLLGLAQYTGARQYKRDGYELLSNAFAKLGRGDSAYFFLQKYTEMKDSVVSKQILWRINNFKKEAAEKNAAATIALLQKDNSIKNQRLKTESLFKNIFIAGILTILLLGLILFRYITLKRKNEKQGREVAEKALWIEKLENEKEQAALKHKTAELEMLALQMKNEKELERSQLIARQKDELEEQVANRTAELKQSLDNLKSTQAQLIQSEKMASLGELTAGIAHEIQNPLNFVNNFSEVSRELIDELKSQKSKLKSEEQDEILNDIDANLEKINHHGKRADAIVKGMLQHSRKSEGIKEPTNINALCDEYLRLSYHGLRAKDKEFNAEIKTDFDETIGKINIIPQDIGRVLLNLFNNAFYALKPPNPLKGEQYKPLVSVSTRKITPLQEMGAKVEIIVTDNGNGIPQKIVDKIFQPFFTTKPTGSGTGLGLSLSYDIIKAHGGEIKVETKEGEGSEFIINLPFL